MFRSTLITFRDLLNINKTCVKYRQIIKYTNTCELNFCVYYNIRL
jgi:hypothetical protein